jgi:hypothetical protein
LLLLAPSHHIFTFLLSLVKRSHGRTVALLSRTPTTASAEKVTSTQSPLCMLSELFHQYRHEDNTLSRP